MLRRNFDGGAAKRRKAAQPLIDDSRQRILIAGRTRAPLQLLRGQVERATRDLLAVLSQAGVSTPAFAVLRTGG